MTGGGESKLRSGAGRGQAVRQRVKVFEGRMRSPWTRAPAAGDAHVVPFAHGMRGIDDTSWPALGHTLLAELAARPGRLCLVSAIEGNSGQLVERLASDLGLTVGSAGALLTNRPSPPAPDELLDLLDGHPILTDLDLLFWPDLAASPLGLLRSLARRQPLVALWPGALANGRAVYSQPGRPDHYDMPLTDTLVLRPRPTRFPDENPFTIERIAS